MPFFIRKNNIEAKDKKRKVQIFILSFKKFTFFYFKLEIIKISKWQEKIKNFY